MDMGIDQRSPTQSSRWRQIVPIGLSILGSLVAGASLFVGSSPLTSLVVAGIAVTAILGVVFLHNPVYGLYLAILTVFLPEGLLPSNIQSLLNRFTLVWALGTWILNVISNRRTVLFARTTILMMVFISWSIVTLLWAPDVGSGVEQIAQYASRLLLFLLLIINEVQARKSLDGLMKTMALSAWILAIPGAITLLVNGFQVGARLEVLETNINAFSVYLLVMMVGVIWQVMISSGKKKMLCMVLSVLYIVLALTLVALGGSRGGALSFVVVLLVFWLWKPTRPWGKVGLALLAISIIVTPFVFSTLVTRLAEPGSDILGGRTPIWRAAWMLIQDHFWIGVGIGNGSQAVIPYLGLFASVLGRQERALHNPLLQIWAETGLVGLLLYVSVPISALFTFVKQYLKCIGGQGRIPVGYFGLVTGIATGIMLSWIKGGGMEDNPSYFLLLALMSIPEQLRQSNECLKQPSRYAMEKA